MSRKRRPQGQAQLWPDPDRPRPAIGRMPCCGAPDLGDSYHGGRPYQCVHDYQAQQVAR